MILLQPDGGSTLVDKGYIKSTENMLDESQKDCNVAKVWFYHIANKQPHELYMMMDEDRKKRKEKKK